MGSVVRPPWNQPLTKDESDRMIAAARKVGGEVEAWAVNVYYVQSALAVERDRLLGAARRVVARHPRDCGVTYADYPTGWTCLDSKFDAAELRPERYAEPFRSELVLGIHLCDVCVLRDALDEWEPHPSHDLNKETRG